MGIDVEVLTWFLPIIFLKGGSSASASGESKTKVTVSPSISIDVARPVTMFEPTRKDNTEKVTIVNQPNASLPSPNVQVIEVKASDQGPTRAKKFDPGTAVVSGVVIGWLWQRLQSK